MTIFLDTYPCFMHGMNLRVESRLRDTRQIAPQGRFSVRLAHAFRHFRVYSSGESPFSHQDPGDSGLKSVRRKQSAGRDGSSWARITVTFNINNSIPPTFAGEEEPSQGQKAEEQEPELTSTPNFVVEVIKNGGKKALVLDCHYPEDEVGQEEEDESDIFAIREVSFQSVGESEWKDTNYTLNTDSLDWALYDHLMDFLADRGVDNTFADELVELSTALEHREYITFLEDLKGFVKSQ
ncbi:complement component 1 Q subcomponent-binding protein, mitochondrial [Puma concolor]|uniref:Complement component 1 Q subcomponent-binding protein, mitochondrial n=1 Tax=Puma concolor TaxID=9696 RepID=A0A6P6HJV4_PUMCO|nr:complement component 1 Q subcomponent-binding protein, mitochondrial [Puma concolor]